MRCTGKTVCSCHFQTLILTQFQTYVRVVDKLGNDCSGADFGKHVFDLNNVPFDQIGGDGASCSGLMNVNYESVDCGAVGLVRGGVKVGIIPNQVDPWCPPFVFSNVAGSGALSSVQVSTYGLPD